MKKIILFLPLCFLALLPVKADEGMWTMYNLDSTVYKQMVAEGFQLPYENLYHSDNAIKNAVVNFSGYCSGVVVSPDGLVFTNHHCGFSAINKHSTVEHDYMLNGFYAKTFEEELPNEDMFVSFMREQQDITEQVNALIEGKSADEVEAIIDSLTNAMTTEAKQKDSTLHVSIDPFYEGNKYYATTYQDFRDVRLVFTVPKSMGKYGGETDNWMWPRQTCDFSVFRIYANPKTNGPAEYSKDNVPYHPQSWAPVSLQGYKDGDFAMTVGYPGSTNRYMSSYGIEEMRNIENTTRVQVRDIKLEIMKRYMAQSEKTRIQYENTFASSSNYWKNSIGMNKCIDSIGLIRQKAEYEARIAQWLKDNNNTDPRYAVELDTLKQLYSNRAEEYKTLNYWIESFWKTSEMIRRAIKMNMGMEAKGPQDKPMKQYVEFEDNSDKWNLELDKEMTAAMLRNYALNVPETYQPEVVKTVKEKFGGDYRRYVDWLYKKSKVLKKGQKFYFNNTKKYLKDPGVALGIDLMSIYAVIGVGNFQTTTQQIEEQEKKLCAAKLRMEQDQPHYSDANFTMRLSYGQVRDVMIGGKPSGYYTTAESLVEKMKQADKNAEYFAEPIMHELMSAKDFGKYQDKETGKMQLCFITNNDITGGNSGSPMFDGQGRLIGLAFDGNWDSLASDILFDKVLARCIGVDIRFVLYMMDKWGHADRLLQEIDAK